jgi:predicted ATPase
VRLFSDRASTRLPNFELAEENAAAVGRICRKLDGIPLAIELAAARTRTMRVEQVAEKLEDSLELLTDGSQTAEPRQRTLRATPDWRHELLGEPEKLLFCRLSVFAGGWTLEAAEAVASGGTIACALILPRTRATWPPSKEDLAEPKMPQATRSSRITAGPLLPLPSHHLLHRP